MGIRLCLKGSWGIPTESQRHIPASKGRGTVGAALAGL
jgi:hypothetical protein